MPQKDPVYFYKIGFNLRSSGRGVISLSQGLVQLPQGHGILMTTAMDKK